MSVRIAGVDLPKEKCLEYALQYIHGVGPKRAKDIVKDLGLDGAMRTHTLTSDQKFQINEYIASKWSVEGTLRREVGTSIKRLLDIGCYRGSRHKRGLPVRGQRTRTNARTRKGKRKTVAGKKMATK